MAVGSNKNKQDNNTNMSTSKKQSKSTKKVEQEVEQEIEEQIEQDVEQENNEKYKFGDPKKAVINEKGIVTGNNFYGDNFTFGNIKEVSNPNGKGKKVICNLRYSASNMREPIQFFVETPIMKAPFGVSSYDEKYSLNLSFEDTFGDENNGIQLRQFEHEILRLEKRLIEHVYKNRQNTSKLKSVDDLKDMKYHTYSIVKKKDDYPNKLQPTIPKLYVDNKVIEDKPRASLFTADKKPIEIGNFEDLKKAVPKQSFIKCILGLSIYFVNDKFGITVKVLSIILISTTPKLADTSNCLFSDTLDETEESTESQEDKNDNVNTANSDHKSQETNELENSDDENKDEFEVQDD